MKHENYDELYDRFNLALTQSSDLNLTPVKFLSEALAICREFFNALRQLIIDRSFVDQADEIHFFKYVKPKFVAKKIFHFELYGLEMNQPIGTKDVVIQYFNSELSIIQRYFVMHAAFYQYYKTERTELDSNYFTRGAVMVVVDFNDMQDADPMFSTPMDYMFARFIAYELFQAEILRRIGLLDSSLVAGVASPPKLERGLKWTGKIVNLSELIYGLFYTGQLNNGNVQLSEIVALFERMFLVKIRDVHHTFGEIRERKVSSPSKFIESMATAIQQRVDDDLSYKPN